MNTLKKRTGRLAVLVLTAALLALPGLASAATYYVNCTGGNDANNGLTTGTAWKTITHAAATVPAGTSGAPNVISVAGGTCNIASTEVFPIAFNRNFVSLTGAGSATTIIDATPGGVDILDVNAKGFAVSGFTFRNALDAIDISEGGFTVANNVFDTTIQDGVNFYRSSSPQTTSVAFADMAITGNTFKTTSDGVYVYVDLDFAYNTGLSASFGNFTVSGNSFPVTSGDGIHISELFYTCYMVDGTVTAGNLTVTNNTFTGGSRGIYFWSGVYDMEDSQVTIGNVVVSNNTCTNQSSYGIYLYNWDIEYFYGTTNAVLGNFTVSGNTVTATPYATYPSAYGIYLYYMDYIAYIYDESTVTTGSISVTNNTVDVDEYGIYFYSYGIWDIGQEYWGDTVAITTGPRTISGNTITSNDSYGLYMDMDYIGYNMYGNSTVNYGNITVSNNTITSYYEAFYFYDWYESGIYMYENSSATLGSVTISGNTLTSTNDDAFEFYYEYSGYDMDRNSAVTVGATNFTNNTLNAANGYGMYLYFYEIGYYMYDNASFAMSPFTIDNNTINSYYEGIYLEYSSYSVPAYMEDNASATLPDWIITDNTIDVTGGYEGLEFYSYSNPDDNYDYATTHYGSMLIDNNTFNPNRNAGMSYGIYFYIEDLVEDHYGPGTTTFGDVTITDNKLYAMENEAIYLYYDDIGYSFTGAPTLTVGDIEIGNNTIDTAPYGIDAYFYNLYTADRAQVTFGKVNIHDNTLTNISNTGIYAYYYNYNNDPDNGATLTVGAPTISGNSISGSAASGDGIYFYVDNFTEGITFGKPVISGNTVSGFNQGIYLDNVEEASLSCNYLENNAAVGIRFATAGTNFAVNTNSIVGNNVGLSVDNGYAAVINAENNWWGDKLGPTACASCNGVNPGDSGTVDFIPWLTYQPQQSRCGMAFPWIMFTPAITGMGN